MTNKQIERVWTLVNKLRGAIDAVDFLKIMLYAIFLKYVEFVKKEKRDLKEELVEAYDERFSLGYLALTYGKMIKGYDIEIYFRNLEKNLKLEQGVISAEIEALLCKNEEETIRNLFLGLNEIKFENQKDFFQLAKMLVKKTVLFSGKMGAESFTSFSLAKLEGRLLDCKEGMSIYDPYCGSGIAICEASDGKGNVFMQDIHVGTLAMATIIMILGGNKNAVIKCGDSLLNPISVKGKYDRIICEPPFGLKYNKEYFSRIPIGNCVYTDVDEGETLPIRHAVAHLEEEGIAAVLVPAGMLFKSGKVGKNREYFVDKGYVDAIIELPSGILPTTNIAIALILLKKNKNDKAIYMINAKSFFKIDIKNKVISDEDIEKVAELYFQRKNVEGVAKVVEYEQIIKNEYNLCTTQYVTTSLEEGIILKDNKRYVEKYEKLVHELRDIDKKMDEIRSRFI